MINKITTREVKIGSKIIGGDSDILIQSMANIGIEKFDELISQINELENKGCDIIRIAVPDEETALKIPEIKKCIGIPLVADIHFDYRLAILSIENGADKIRINPGNIGDDERVFEIVETAKKFGNVPIRVGINSGSLEKKIVDKYGGVTPEGIAESALKNIKKIDYKNIVLSMKASDIRSNYEAHLRFVELWETEMSGEVMPPFHIGITESGSGEEAVVKSAIGTGALLLNGIGNTIRVSLTGDPVPEIEAGQKILKALGLLQGSINIISCPTCGRCKTDLGQICNEVKKSLELIESRRVKGKDKSLNIAIMGCAVNGPGEAKEADFGFAFNGKGFSFFKNGEVVKQIETSEIVGIITSQL